MKTIKLESEVARLTSEDTSSELTLGAHRGGTTVQSWAEIFSNSGIYLYMIKGDKKWLYY